MQKLTCVNCNPWWILHQGEYLPGWIHHKVNTLEGDYATWVNTTLVNTTWVNTTHCENDHGEIIVHWFQGDHYTTCENQREQISFIHQTSQVNCVSETIRFCCIESVGSSWRHIRRQYAMCAAKCTKKSSAAVKEQKRCKPIVFHLQIAAFGSSAAKKRWHFL